MTHCSESGSEIETSYAWSLDHEPVCSAYVRAAVPGWLWYVVEMLEWLMEPADRTHSEALRN